LVQPDSAAASLMAQGRVDLVLVGADRIARNGDVANKLGTFPLAVVARHHGVPFYSVAPSSSFDPACPSGAAIPIEHRPAAEVTAPLGVPVAPAASAAFNPAFDITPAALVRGYVTERGIVHPPFEE
jgi:methylthioribose-1-phosphate isomerase